MSLDYIGVKEKKKLLKSISIPGFKLLRRRRFYVLKVTLIWVPFKFIGAT